MAEARLQSEPANVLTSQGRARVIENLVTEPLAAAGYDVVRVQFSGDRQPKLQIMLERRDGVALSVGDCAGNSRLIEAILDVEDPVAGAYVLEVSSPGIDRPLTRLGDFDRFAGLEARIELHQTMAGQRRFRGRLLGLEGDRVRLATDTEEVLLAFGDIAKAKLVLTDALIAANQGTG